MPDANDARTKTSAAGQRRVRTSTAGRVRPAPFYAVTTTGIYCRTGCASRRPNPGNVRAFDTAAAAAKAGFRPCKRCRPDAGEASDRASRLAIEACRTIENAESAPGLADLAAAAGLSPSRFQRVFKSIVGITPKQYALETRSGRVRARLREGRPVAAALYAAGFAGSSRFYESAAATLGMRPSDYQNGGPGARIRFAVARSRLGPVLVAATERGVCAIEFGASPAELERRLHSRFPKAEIGGPDRDLRRAVAKVLALIDAPRQVRADLPLDIRGTAFQRRVWQALQGIPSGATATYAEIAAKIGAPRAARAVARACAANPVAVVVPCHRVIRTDGGLGGYRWGIERKKALLAKERKRSRAAA